MRAFFYSSIIVLFLILSVFATPGKASHIRAGDITAKRVNNTTYTFTLTIYANVASTVRDDYAVFDFGDGTSQSVFYNNSEVLLNADTYKRTYVYTKVFSGNGTFRVSYSEKYRNANIKNIAQSDATPFYVETFITLSAFAAVNNPVQFTIPPIDKAAVGKIFVHNPGAYDPDGDSLSYKMIVPRSAPGVAVNGYFTPNYSTSFSLDAVTGDLVWNAPVLPGLYNVAFIVEEWRKGADGGYSRVGFVTRDMQIEVINSNNNPPVLIIPEDTCIVAGASLNKVIRASDPNVGNKINIYSNPTSHFSFSGPQFSIASGNFNWTTQCSDIRDQPYAYVFQAVDVGSADVLTDYKTWLIYVKGPAPTNLSSTAVGNAIALSWNPYSCSNAEVMEIYRKSCDSSGYRQQPCEAGNTGFPGYEKIGEVPIGTTNFLDNNNGLGLERGTEYCYFIVARFPLPKGGKSYASAESCTGLKLDVPILANASVIVTSSTAGVVALTWLPPTESPLSGPYTYNIQRADGIGGTSFTTISSGFSGTIFTDNSLNTLDNGYTYRVELVGGGFSDPVTTTFIKNIPGNRSMNLSWESNVPWQEDSVWLFRSINGSSYIQIASLVGNPKKYLDAQGLQNCDTACYYLRIFSSFCDPKLPVALYENTSEITCGVPTDVTPPRAPDLSVKGCEGDLSVFTDLLDWNDVADPLCNNIQNYNVYFSEYIEKDLRLIATTDFTITDYVYMNLQSTAGCFVVSAVNRQGVEGYKSKKVCVDDCVYYDLPNLITPNGDSLNDRFRPFPIPRGVEVVDFKVYNRWGGIVFSMNNDININWTGRSNDGEKLSDGVYYFSAEVKYFRRKNKADEYKTLKGWVQVLDNQGSSAVE